MVRGEASLVISKELGDERGIALSLIDLGLVAKLREEPGKAEEYYQRAFTISEKLICYLENFRQNDQKIFNLSFRAQREIFCLEEVTNAQDFSLRSK
uniref:Tetratricopeptide repeat-containing protein n=1 Tax=Candidatus Kentrum sp. LFY TaxID=2126342 RepID=A0A450UFB6_9GAMM|nr:MAG: hypothetical protein BECKLFY1418A_GA0070994_10153 [Candidatus Kentron sp. LFY]